MTDKNREALRLAIRDLEEGSTGCSCNLLIIFGADDDFLRMYREHSKAGHEYPGFWNVLNWERLTPDEMRQIRLERMKAFQESLGDDAS